MNSNHSEGQRERQLPAPMCTCFQSGMQGPMVSSNCPACSIERCINQGIPPELATMEDMVRKLEDLCLEASRKEAENQQQLAELTSRAMQEPDDAQNYEIDKGIRALHTSANEVQQLIMRIRWNKVLLCQGGILLESSIRSSSGIYQQILQLTQQDQAEVLNLQREQSRVHELMIQRDLRTYQNIIATGRNRCTIL